MKSANFVRSYHTVRKVKLVVLAAEVSDDMDEMKVEVAAAEVSKDKVELSWLSEPEDAL